MNIYNPQPPKNPMDPMNPEQNSNKSRIIILIVGIIIITTVVEIFIWGKFFYKDKVENFAEEKISEITPSEESNLNQELIEIKQELEQLKKINEELKQAQKSYNETSLPSSEPTPESLPQFETMQEYIDFSLLTSRDIFTSEIPEEYIKTDFFDEKFLSSNVATSIYVWSNNQDLFYIEFSHPPSCITQKFCDEEPVSKYYGPFRGNLSSLLK